MCFCVLYLIDIVKNFQLNEYSMLSIFKERWCWLKSNLFVFILMSFFTIVMFMVDASVWFLILPIIINILYLCYIKIDIVAANKIVYTKRMFRLLFVSVMLLGLVVWCLYYLHFDILVKVGWGFVLLSFVIVWLANLCLMPIEYGIKKYYLKTAKIKISEHKTLVKVAITGSFGKTSTKEILATLLSEKYNVLSVPKSFNTPMGISKTINSSLTNTKEIFVCEMGARKSGEINELCQLVAPQMGIVTSVGRQHTNTFGNIEGVYKTKKELPDYLNKGLCVFNIENSFTHKMYDEFVGDKVGVFLVQKKNTRISKALIKNALCSKNLKHNDYDCVRSCIFYEKPHKNNYYAKNIKKTELGVEFDVYENFLQLGVVSVSLLGVHNIINCLLSIAISRRLGLSWQKIKLGFGKVKQIEARLQKISLGNGAIVINNGYNSNLDSAKESLKVLNVFNKIHKVVITPGIVETSDDFGFNREFGKLISRYATDVIIVKNKNKEAILAGLSESCFDINRVFFVSDFRNVKNVLLGANENYVFLIENDLPDNFK